jgi:aminoglycoside/choline kinase family phosphotransferase
MYRDFQARNVMLVCGDPWFLDYQSGRRGPLPYDVASLLFDGAARMPPEVREILLDDYLQRLKKRRSFDLDSFLATFPGFALLRILQALGAYGYLSRRRSKRHYLARIPAALRNLEWLARQWPADLPELSRLWRTVEELQQQAHLRYLA